MAGGARKINEYNKTLTPEQRKESARRAAKASVETRKRNKSIRETMRILADSTVANEKIKATLIRNGLKEGDATNSAAVGMSIMMGAIRGNPHLVRIYLELLGEIDNKKIEVSGAVNVKGNPFDELTIEELRSLAGRK